jgi:inosine/xanthosine triphosphate pyrophosphatase family protein
MSIIIVGVGDEDFSYMHILDNVEEIKKHAKEDIKAKVRDVVQFVAYKEFKNDSDQLCAKVLDNFPKQFMEYMKLHSIEPNELQ